VEYSPKAPLGKKRVTKQELVPEPSTWERSEEEAAAILSPLEVDGWKGSVYELYDSKNGVTGPNGEKLRRVTYVRYVDPEETA
jgi:hypothetical protein